MLQTSGLQGFTCGCPVGLSAIQFELGPSVLAPGTCKLEFDRARLRSHPTWVVSVTVAPMPRERGTPLGAGRAWTPSDLVGGASSRCAAARDLPGVGCPPLETWRDPTSRVVYSFPLHCVGLGVLAPSEGAGRQQASPRIKPAGRERRAGCQHPRARELIRTCGARAHQVACPASAW